MVITTFNRQDILPRAIRSVLSQTFDDFELIVVDDHSTDGTPDAIRMFGDSRITYICRSENGGLSRTRNTGIAASRGEYVAFLDDDDEWKPEKLEKQVALANASSPEYGVFHCGADKLDARGRLVAKSLPKGRGNVRTEFINRRVVTISSTYLFRKSTLEEIGGFDENLTSHIDYDIWMKMAKAEVHSDYVDETLVILRDDGRERMTSNVRPRIAATRAYIEKWGPDITAWLGGTEGRDFIAQLRTGIMMRLAANAIARWNLTGVSRCVWESVKHQPSNPKVYLGFLRLFAEIGTKKTGMYRPLKRIKDTVLGVR